MFRQSERQKPPDLASIFSKHQKNRSKRKFSIIFDVYRSGKFIELTSFLYWSVLHHSRLLKRVNFTQHCAIIPNESWSNLRSKDRVSCSEICRSEHPWKLLFSSHHSSAYGVSVEQPNILYSVQNGEIVSNHVFEHEILSLFVSRNLNIFVSLSNGEIFTSRDRAKSFLWSLSLSHIDSYFRFSYGMTETTDGVLFIGEYGNATENHRWISLPYIYTSIDEGVTWKKNDFLKKYGVNKHVHILKYFPRVDLLLLTDGDNLKKLWSLDWSNTSARHQLKWKLLNRFHLQMGGFTSIVDCGDKMLLGTDYNGGTNFIVQMDNRGKQRKRALDGKYRQSPIFSMHKRLSNTGIEVWATLWSNANLESNSALIVSYDSGNTWNRIIEYNGSKNRIHLCSDGSSVNDNLYFCVTKILRSGSEEPLETYVICDRTTSMSETKS